MDNYNQNTGNIDTPQGSNDPVTGGYNAAPTPDSSSTYVPPVTPAYDYETPGYGAASTPDYTQQSYSPTPDYTQQSYSPTPDYTQQSYSPTPDYTQQAYSPTPDYTQQTYSPPTPDYTQQATLPTPDYTQPAYTAPTQQPYGQQQPYMQQTYAPQYGQGYAYPGQPVPGKNQAITSLVLGIFGLVGGFIPYLSYLALPASIVGLVMAIKARKLMPAGQNGIATGGLICSAIGVGLSAIFTICYAVILAGACAISNYSYSILFPIIARFF